MTFVEITEMVRARDALIEANEQLRLVVVARDARDAITVQDMGGRILAWNPYAERIYGWTEAEALAMNLSDRLPKDLHAEEMTTLTHLACEESLAPHDTRRTTKSGDVLNVRVIATALINEAGQLYAIATTERLIT
jgi:two-component system CheB/CheR fusion protein